jgi:polysaccharide deacetylase 2 family uncharacterized protein YibQ
MRTGRRTRRRRILKKRTRDILAISAIGVLIAVVLILAGILIHSQKTPGVKKETPSALPPVSRPGTNLPAASEKVILGEQLLIKGCLFDLGLSKDNLRIKGRTIDITPGGPLKEDQIRYVFAPLEELGDVKVKVEGTSKVTILINSHEWELYFYKRAAPEKKLALAAIIIDDMGMDMDIARRLSSIDEDLTFSIMPFQAHTQGVADLLHAKGKEILLHMPMEGANGKNPGQGAIYRDMNTEQALTLLKDAMNVVPHIVGVNNHMGSEVTQNDELMRSLLAFIKEKDLFFIDSVTSGRSVCGEVASELHIPFEARDVFLDNEQNYAYVAGQIEVLISVAKRHGKAIAICHPHPVTVQVLADKVPGLKARGVAVVRVSELVKDRN